MTEADKQAIIQIFILAETKERERIIQLLEGIIKSIPKTPFNSGWHQAIDQAIKMIKEME